MKIASLIFAATVILAIAFTGYWFRYVPQTNNNSFALFDRATRCFTVIVSKEGWGRVCPNEGTIERLGEITRTTKD